MFFRACAGGVISRPIGQARLVQSAKMNVEKLLIVVVALAIGEYLFCYPVVATMYIAYYTLLYS